jgi:hypothetical protein
MDMNKYRKMSAFVGTGGGSDYERKMVLKQAKNEFDIYQQYSPNTHKVYVNDSPTPILATFQDVSDLEVRADTKWLATSLENKIYAGDIITWNVNGEYQFDANGVAIGRKWLVVYDKDKNTANSYKVKVQPCNYAIKFPFYKEDRTPEIYTGHSIIMTYLTDTKDFKQPFPTEVGTTFVSLPYNKITATIKPEARIWLYDKVFEVGGVDFTNIDFYTGKGFLKWTLRPATKSLDVDRIDLGVADYYKFFAKPTIISSVSDSVIVMTSSATKVNVGSKVMINVTAPTDVQFAFEGLNMGCTITNITGNSCVLNIGNEIGIVYVKAYLIGDPTQSQKLRFTIGAGL